MSLGKLRQDVAHTMTVIGGTWLCWCSSISDIWSRMSASQIQSTPAIKQKINENNLLGAVLDLLQLFSKVDPAQIE